MDEPASEASPFHAGEQRVQEAMGVHRGQPWVPRAIRSYLPEQHRDFYRGLPFLVVAARDDAGRPWASLLTGTPGFIRSPDVHTLQIGATPPPTDALAGALVAGSALGLLGVDFATRRRNRANGRVLATGAGGITVGVQQTFGNCPKYLWERTWRRVAPGPPLAFRSNTLSPPQRALVARARTLFIASGYSPPSAPGMGEDAPNHGLDASHRGGPPGFVSADGAGRLSFPDYAGNNYFNTLGNLVMDPRVGLTFIDFGQGSVLQLSGRARLDWHPGTDPAQATQATRAAPPGSAEQRARLTVRVTVDAVVEQPGALPLRWVSPDPP